MENSTTPEEAIEHFEKLIEVEKDLEEVTAVKDLSYQTQDRIASCVTCLLDDEIREAVIEEIVNNEEYEVLIKHIPGVGY